MVSITPYLNVKSSVEALELYKNIFDAEIIERMPVGKEQASQFNIPDGTDLSQTTMHASFKIGDALFFMSDNFSGKVLEHTNVSLSLTPDSLEQAQNMFKRAEENGSRVTMKFEKQFWGDYFGSFVDPMGISWQMNVTPAEE